MTRHFIWDFIGRISSQIMSFLISIILTRILLPEEYGIVGISLFFINIASVFLDFGFSRALIQSQSVNNLQQSTIFYINIALGLFLYFLIRLLSNSISNFYTYKELSPVLSTLSLLFIINALNIVPSSILFKNMKFRQITLINLLSTVIGGFIGVILAKNGYGIWSLVYQTLATSILVLLCNFLVTKYRPLFAISLNSISDLWRYGSKMFYSGFLDVLFTRMDIFLIGKIFNPSTLGFYTRAQSVDVFIRQISSSSIATVLFSHISSIQEDLFAIKQTVKKYLHLISLFSFYLSGLLYLVSPDLFVFVFSDRWKLSGQLFQIMSIGSFIWPVSNLFCTVIASRGNSNSFLRLEAMKKIFYLPIYGLAFFISVKSFIICLIGVSIISLLLNMYFLYREIDISMKKQFEILKNYFLLTASTTGATFVICGVINTDFLILKVILTGLIFTSLFILILVSLNLEAWKIINNKFQKSFSRYAKG